MHALLSRERNKIFTHIKVGASWEGFVIEQLLQQLKSRDYFFWRTHTGLELDLLVLKYGKKLGFEIKFSESPKVTRSMYSVIENLNLDKLYLVYRGERRLMLGENIYALPTEDIPGQKF